MRVHKDIGLHGLRILDFGFELWGARGSRKLQGCSQ